MKTFVPHPSMPVLHLPEVQGICWEKKGPWSVLPTLHQQAFTPRDQYLYCCWWGAFWLMPLASAGRKTSDETVTPQCHWDPTQPAGTDAQLPGSLGRVWLSLSTFCRFLSSPFLGLIYFDRVRDLLHVCLGWQRNLLLMEEDRRLEGCYSGAARAADGPVLNLLMPCLPKCSHFCHCYGITTDCNWNILETEKEKKPCLGNKVMLPLRGT